MDVRSSARTDVGRTREHNEDSYGIGEGEAVARLGHLFVVCDGMGGHASGEVASARAVEIILKDYYADDEHDRAAAVEQAFQHANQRIFAEGRGTMGTTGVAALILGTTLHIANVGDSRAYLVRGDTIRQISRDHSLVADQVEAGLITPEQARHSNIKNVITRALGHQPDLVVDLFEMPLQSGDVVLLCSDGLHGLVNDDELAHAARDADLDRACATLIALANRRGGSDNITALLVRVAAVEPPAQQTSDTVPLHEQITEPLPVAETAPSGGDTSPAIEAAAPAPATAPAPPTERPLTRLGALLSVLLLVVLVSALLIAQFRPELLPFAAPQATAPTLPPTALPTAQPAVIGSPAAPTIMTTAMPTAPVAPTGSPMPTPQG
jgi:protein phosphatase